MFFLDGNTGNDGERKTGEFSLNEYYIKRHFSDVADSLKLFSDDDLISKPGKGCILLLGGFELAHIVRYVYVTYFNFLALNIIQ